MPESLKVAVGQASLSSQQPPNQDFLAATTPEGEALRSKGVVLAIADGVGKRKGGRDAAETAVRRFMSGWYSSPETWGPRKCLETLCQEIQEDVRRRHPQSACTFTAMALVGRHYYVAHVGDTRAYLWRTGALKLLTEDHTWKNPDFRNVLSRGIGLDQHLHPQFHAEAAEPGDLVFLCSDGFYRSLDPEASFAREDLSRSPQEIAERMVRRAREKDGSDDVSLLVMRVESLPEGGREWLPESASALQVAPQVKEGMVIDGFRLVRRLAKTPSSLVFEALEEETSRALVLKFPHPAKSEDEAFRESFLKEEWIGRRIRCTQILPVLPLEPGRRSCLYYAMPLKRGLTLRQYLAKHGALSAETALGVGIDVCRALLALHRQRVLHRDIKPDNIFLEDGGGALLMDLGVAHVEAFDREEGDTPGSPSYMAPELFHGSPPGEAAEVFAFGVSLYEALTLKLPYGEIQPFVRPKFGNPVPPSRYNPELPLWLETIILKAIDPEPERRFQVISEALFFLERQERVPDEEAPSASPRLEVRLFRWRVAAIFCAVVAVLEFLLLVDRRF